MHKNTTKYGTLGLFYFFSCHKMKRIIVGLSGGVDSAVTALLLKQQGYDVTCVFMKNWEEDDTDTYCPSAQDLADAQAICEHLDLPLQTVNFANSYWDNVFEYFLQNYKAGLTPNPDILCNREIKFKAFLDYALKQGVNTIATGHYARTDVVDNSTQLLTGKDPLKDQSYFLYALNQYQIHHACFPLGGYSKQAVRALAAEHHIPVYDKKDSTGICFIGERKFKSFLEQYLPGKSGDIVDEAGVVIGQHDGLMYYTIGQRQGLKIGGLKSAQEAPWYVAAKDLEKNQLKVVQGQDHPALFKASLTAKDLTWISGKAPTKRTLQAKIRYRQTASPCTLTVQDNTLKVEFEHPQRAVTPGQSIVFYDDEVCLGGGIITNV